MIEHKIVVKIYQSNDNKYFSNEVEAKKYSMDNTCEVAEFAFSHFTDDKKLALSEISKIKSLPESAKELVIRKAEASLDVVLNQERINQATLFNFPFISQGENLWRKSRGNDLKKAIALITDPKTKLKELSNKIDWTYQTLRIYRSKPEMLTNASWTQINKIARIYDKQDIADHMSEENAKKLRKVVSYLCTNLIEENSQNKSIALISSEVSNIINSDPLALLQIYEALHVMGLLDDVNSFSNDKNI